MRRFVMGQGVPLATPNTLFVHIKSIDEGSEKRHIHTTLTAKKQHR